MGMKRTIYRTFQKRNNLSNFKSVGVKRSSITWKMSMDDTAGNHLFQLVSNAYERQSLIVTSNRSFEEWGALFPNSSLASATLDRLLHHVSVFTFSGDSYRMKGVNASL